MNFLNIQFTQLMAYGVHIGHSKKNTLLGTAWMIAAFRQSISIINLWKSVYLLKLTLFLISNIVAFLGTIWFVNLNASSDRYVRFAASLCGELAITSKWIRGAVSNYWSTFNTYRLIAHVPESVLSSKYNKFKSFFNNWHFSRFTWPRALFFSSVHTSYFPAREASALKIPGFGIVDTNTWSHAVSLPIPGNDESVFCSIFYNDVIANYILIRKFSLVLMWFLNVRSAPRIISFSRWLRSQYKLTTKDFNLYKDFSQVLISNNNNHTKVSPYFFRKM